MKKLLFILILFFVVNKNYGQTYYPFPTSYGIWSYQEYDDFHNPLPNFTTLYMGGDTAFGSNSYKKLLNGPFFLGGIRESSKRIYFYDLDSANEYLLYDFNIHNGDTLLNVFNYYSDPDTVFVGSEDSIILADGNYHKQWWVNCIPWAEGLGNEWTYLLNAAPPTCSVSGGWVLTCFMSDGVQIYSNGGYCITKMQSISSMSNTFEVYPNPSQDFISIKYSNKDNTKCYYKIADITGKVLTQGKISNDKINIENLSQGIYFITIENNNNRETKKFIKN